MKKNYNCYTALSGMHFITPIGVLFLMIFSYSLTNATSFKQDNSKRISSKFLNEAMIWNKNNTADDVIINYQNSSSTISFFYQTILIFQSEDKINNNYIEYNN